MSHTIQHEKFTGPISVLFEMIEARKLSVSEFSLTTVTENFLDYVRNLKDIDKEEVSQFIVVASLLMLLKSKSLLPDLELTEDENRDLQVLESQIACFEILKSRTKIIRTAWGKNIFFGAKNSKVIAEKMFVPDREMSEKYFHIYILSRMQEILPKEDEKKEVKVHKTVKIEDALEHVRNVIRRIKKLNFKEINGSGDARLSEKNKRNIVILFIAVLELVKMGEIDVIQDENFSDILVLETI